MQISQKGSILDGKYTFYNNSCILSPVIISIIIFLLDTIKISRP